MKQTAAPRWVFMAILLLAGIVAPSDSRAEESETKQSIEFTTKKRGNISTIFASNPFAFPVTLTIELAESSENTSMRPRSPATVVLRPNSKRRVVTIKPTRRNKRWNYQTKTFTKYGDFSTKHDPETVYRLPYAKGESYRLSQGPFGDFSHQQKVAYDFGLPEGSQICAARAGRVVRVIEHFTEGGVKESFKDRANLIFILHEDGSIAVYYHLIFEGSQVELGDQVEEGQVIALSGNTGYSQGPHLHFELYRPLDGKTMGTEPIRFLTAEGPTDELVTDQSYVNPDD